MTPEQTAWIEAFAPRAKRIALSWWRQKGGDQSELIATAYMGLVEAALRYPEYCQENEYDVNASDFREAYFVRKTRGVLFDRARSEDHARRSYRDRYKAGDTSPEVLAEIDRKPVYIDETLSLRLSSPGRPETSALENGLLLEAARFINALPVQERAVICLRYFANLELKQIAKYFGVPESRVGTMHTNAVLKIRDRLAGQIRGH